MLQEVGTLVDRSWREVKRTMADLTLSPDVEIPETAHIEDGGVLCFKKWTYDELKVPDRSLVDYIAINQRAMVHTAHTAGRWQHKRFRKAQIPIVERWLMLSCNMDVTTVRRLWPSVMLNK